MNKKMTHTNAIFNDIPSSALKRLGIITQEMDTR